MSLIDFFKKLICLRDSTQNTDSKVTFTNPTSSISNKEIGFSSKNTILLKPLTSQDVFSSQENDLTGNEEIDEEITEFKIQPLPYTKRPTLVLDLDNTLVYATTKEPEIFHHKFSIFYNGKITTVWILERPGLKEFLSLVSQYYEVVLFTAGIQKYGVKVMQKIDVNKNINYFMDRRFCTFLGRNAKDQEIFTKDIRILGREEKQILLIDDREYSFILNKESGVLVKSFDGDLNDTCLDKLGKYLIFCSSLTDLRFRQPFDIYE